MSDPAAACTVERHFLGWDAPLLPRAAGFLYGRYAQESHAGPVGLNDVLVVVPGRRAGRRLRELLVEEAQSRGRVLRLPDIVTVGVLPDHLGAWDGRPAQGVHVRLAWMAALRAWPSEDLEPLLAATPAPEERGRWWALAAELARLRRELLGEAVDFPQAARKVGVEVPEDGPRWDVLAELAQDVDRRLEAASVRDPARMTLDAVGAGRASAGGRTVCLVGTAELPETIRGLLACLTDPVRALVHAPEEEAAAFREDGTIRVEAWEDRPLPVAEDQVVVTGGPAAQAQAVVRALEDTGGRWGPSDVAVGLGNDDARPHVEQVLATAKVPHRYAPGHAVAASRPGRLLRAAADYLRDGAADALAALLRHPDVGAALGTRVTGIREDAWLAALDVYRRDHLPARIPAQGPDAWDGEGGRKAATPPSPPQALSVVLDQLLGPEPVLLAALRPSGQAHPLRTWAPAMLEFLLAVYGHEPVDRTRPEGRHLLEALDAIRNRLVELRELPESLDAPVPAAEALEAVLREVQDDTIPPEPNAGAVELLGWLELRLDDAPAVVVTGMNEGQVPESVHGDPFLPDGLRSMLGLVDNRRRYARDALALTTLVRSRPLVRFVAGRRDADGNPLRPSRLLLAVPDAALPARVLRFVEGPAEAEPLGDDLPSAEERDDAGIGFPLPPEPVIQPDAPLESLAVTQFRNVLADPYLFALQRILKLEEVDDGAREMDPAGFGNLVHEVLQRFGVSDAASSPRFETVRDYARDTLDAYVRERFGSAPLPAVRIQIEQARRRLDAFARAQADWAGLGWRIVAVEARTPRGGGAPFPGPGGEPFRLTGIIDRIDHHPERGQWAVLDYKTGEKVERPERTHRKGKGADARWVDLQLPLYRHLLPVLEEPVELPIPPEEAGPEHLLLGYFGLPREAEKAGLRFAEWDLEALAGADEAARQVIGFLLENRFRHAPDVPLRPGDALAKLRGAEVFTAPGDSAGGNGSDATNRGSAP